MRVPSTTSSAPSRAIRESRGSTRSPPTRAARPSTRTTPSCRQSRARRSTPASRPGLPQIVYQAAGVVTLDGTRPECGWANERGAVEPGILAPSHLPILKRRDYVQNSNDSYWYTNPKRPLTGFSPIIGGEGTELGLRTRYGLRTIANRLAGKDGLPGRKYTLCRLRTLWQRDDSEAGRLLADQLASLCEANPTVMVDGQPVDVRAACPIFRSWDTTARLDSKGAWLFDVWWRAVRRRPSPTRSILSQPLTTPNRLAASAGQRRRDRCGGEEPACAPPAARRDDAPGPVRTPARPQGSAPRLLERLLSGHRSRRRPESRERHPGRPVRYGQVVEGSSIVMQVELTGHGPEGHDDPHLLAIREPALAPLGRPDEASSRPASGCRSPSRAARSRATRSWTATRSARAAERGRARPCEPRPVAVRSRRRPTPACPRRRVPWRASRSRRSPRPC